MRFLFVDRVTRLEKGRRITGVKSFAASEPFLEMHFTRTALVPGAILVEAMAQLLGWLVTYSHDFRSMAILAMISDASVPTSLRPGTRVEIDARLLANTEHDSLGTVTAAVDGQTIARVDRMIFGHVPIPAGEMTPEFLFYYAGVDDPSSLETIESE